MKENLVKMTREEVKVRQLHVLKEMDRFCKEHNIKYMLAYGTLIGAIRHKGFIPWDDDIDVMLLRPDYDRFVAEYKDNEDFGVANIYTRKDYPFNFARLFDKHSCNVRYNGRVLDYGINIDVYPLDGVPESDEIFEKQRNLCVRRNHRREIVAKLIRLSQKTPYRPFLNLLLSLSYSNLRKTDLIVRQFDYDSSPCVSVVASNATDKHKKELFKEVIEVEFEGYKFPAPVGYHEILTNYYGDYMQLPPEEQRVPYHGGNYYWIK